jgi:hypothetical protein
LSNEVRKLAYIKEFVRMPFTGFWDRWRRRQLEQQGCGSAQSLRETEKQREAAERQATRELAMIVAEAGDASAAGGGHSHDVGSSGDADAHATDRDEPRPRL